MEVGSIGEISNKEIKTRVKIEKQLMKATSITESQNGRDRRGHSEII